MSPNGRRRFRKMNRRFRQRGPAGVRERARKTTGGMARKMILVQYWGRDPLPLPVKPFTARSLVGMSEGAKKRLRRTTSKLLDQMQANLASLWHHHDAVRNDSFLRIGERLRPCPGCCACQPCGKTAPQLCIDRCAGSGVLPARKEQS